MFCIHIFRRVCFRNVSNSQKEEVCVQNMKKMLFLTDRVVGLFLQKYKQKVYIYYVYIQYKEVICKKGVLSYGNLTGILRESYGTIP